MTTLMSGPARQLITLLETLPTEERQEITAWLLGVRQPWTTPLPAPWPPATTAALPEISGASGPEDRARRLAAALPAGEDSQLVTIRLTAERHARLRAWCAEHGFTMAAVVRGLVERFLEERGPATGKS